MKIQHIVSLLLLAVCSNAGAQTTNTFGQTNTTMPATQKSEAAAKSKDALPTWYVFKIKAFHKVTYSDDRSFAIVEGVTMKDKEFKVKLVWDESFKEAHPKSIDQWLKKSKADFEAGIPYVISGEVISRDPLTVKPATVVGHAPNFGAPPENVY